MIYDEWNREKYNRVKALEGYLVRIVNASSRKDVIIGYLDKVTDDNFLLGHTKMLVSKTSYTPPGHFYWDRPGVDANNLKYNNNVLPTRLNMITSIEEHFLS